MKFLYSLGVLALSAASTVAAPGGPVSKPPAKKDINPFLSSNQGTTFGRPVPDVSSNVKRDNINKIDRRDAVDDLAAKLEEDGYEPWCREEYLHLHPTATKTNTKTVTKTTTVKRTNTVKIPSTKTGPSVTSSVVQTSSVVTTVTGPASTTTITTTFTSVSTSYAATTTSFTAPPYPPFLRARQVGALHHLKPPPYADKYTDWVLYQACEKIADRTKLTTTVYKTATRTSTATSTIKTTTTVVTTVPGVTKTVTSVVRVTGTSVVPGSTVTSTVSTTTTVVTTLPTQIIFANPCDTNVATWHITDEGFGPCCADWTPVEVPTAYECCAKCWNTPGCPGWFYGLPIEGSWQAGLCWTPPYLEPLLGDDPKCPAGKIALSQQPPPEGVVPDLQVAQGPCLAPGGDGDWSL